MSKPIEDSPSLVDLLAREHAARRASIEAEAAQLAHEPPRSESVPAIVAPPARASSPRILVEELSRQCCERRAALDAEARDCCEPRRGE